jgi:hypothetical protein
MAAIDDSIGGVGNFERWLKPSNGLQSIGICPDMEIGLMVAGGCYSIGVIQT